VRSQLRTDLSLELRPLILAVVLVAALPLEAQQKGQCLPGQFGLKCQDMAIAFLNSPPQNNSEEFRNGEGWTL